MRRWFRKILVAVSAVLCLAFFVQWTSSYVSGRWFAVRRADETFNVISNNGWLVLQRAHLRYQPAVQGWNYSHGQCLDRYGPVSPSSVFEYVGLVDASIRIPWDVDPAWGPSAFASSIQATGRNISIPSLLLVVVAGYAPTSAVIRRVRQSREARRRGFGVGSSS